MSITWSRTYSERSDLPGPIATKSIPSGSSKHCGVHSTRIVLCSKMAAVMLMKRRSCEKALQNTSTVDRRQDFGLGGSILGPGGFASALLCSNTTLLSFLVPSMGICSHILSHTPGTALRSFAWTRFT